MTKPAQRTAELVGLMLESAIRDDAHLWIKDKEIDIYRSDIVQVLSDPITKSLFLKFCNPLILKCIKDIKKEYDDEQARRVAKAKQRDSILQAVPALEDKK